MEFIYNTRRILMETVQLNNFTDMHFHSDCTQMYSHLTLQGVGRSPPIAKATACKEWKIQMYNVQIIMEAPSKHLVRYIEKGMSNRRAAELSVQHSLINS